MKPHVVGTGPCDKMEYDDEEDYDWATEEEFWQEDEDDYWYEGYYDEFQDDEDDYNPRGQKGETR